MLIIMIIKIINIKFHILHPLGLNTYLIYWQILIEFYNTKKFRLRDGIMI